MGSLILASQSPRRVELLSQLGVACRQCPVDIDERPHAGEAPLDYVERMAREKAGALADPDGPVIAADTSVVIDGHILGKPVDREDALRMLALLSARTHDVYTSVALRYHSLDSRVQTTHVTFRELPDDERRWYWATGEPADKAGAYAVQGKAAQFITRIEGSFSGVMGLPLFETAELLRAAGLQNLLRESMA